MVLRYRGQLRSFDRALRRGRLWNRLGSSGPRLQAGPGGACFRVAGFSPGRCGRVVVRQTSEYFKAIAGRIGNRSASADAPNERQSRALVEVNFVAVADLITSRASATLQKAASSSPRRIRPVADRRTPKPRKLSGRKSRADLC